MNERIRELVKQAGGHFSTRNLMSNPVQHRESIELWDDRIEKFAQLIVKDCAEAALAKGRASPDTDFRTGSYVISEYLLSRYGVEE